MADYKQLCVELLDRLECLYNELVDSEMGWVLPEAQELITRTHAELAEPEPEGPTDDELNALWNCCGIADEYGHHEGNFFDFARAVLARWGNHSTPQPADGEVAELVAWMRNQVTVHEAAQTQWAKRFVRAASLLERLSPPQPVPVNERLPKAEDCDAEGMCWWYCAPAERWLRCGIPEPNPASQVHTHWLPALALPQPS